MPVHFKITRPNDADRRILADVPPPALPDYHRCGLAQALASALTYCGQTVDYSFVMGLSTLAFAVKQPDSFAEEPALAAPLEHIRAALQALGYESQIAADEPSLSVERIMQTVKTAVEAGQPTVAYGWGPDPPVWALITGYNRAQDLLYGYPIVGEAQPLLEVPPPTKLLISLGPAGESQAQAEAVQQALSRGAELWDDPPPDTGPRAYHTLLDLLADGSAFATDFPEGAVAAHEALIAGLIDARAAAMDFLPANAELFPDIPAAWLQQAADLYAPLVDLLETRTPPIFDSLTSQALADPQWRQEWSERLRQVAELDIEAGGCLGRAFSAEFAPGGEQEYEG